MKSRMRGVLSILRRPPPPHRYGGFFMLSFFFSTYLLCFRFSAPDYETVSDHLRSSLHAVIFSGTSCHCVFI